MKFFTNRTMNKNSKKPMRVIENISNPISNLPYCTVTNIATKYAKRTEPRIKRTIKKMKSP